MGGPGAMWGNEAVAIDTCGPPRNIFWGPSPARQSSDGQTQKARATRWPRSVAAPHRPSRNVEGKTTHHYARMSWAQSSLVYTAH